MWSLNTQHITTPLNAYPYLVRYILLWEFSINSSHCQCSKVFVNGLSKIHWCIWPHWWLCVYSHWCIVILVYYMTVMYIMHDACGCQVRRDLPGSMIASISLMATWYHRLMLGHEERIPWDSSLYYRAAMQDIGVFVECLANQINPLLPGNSKCIIKWCESMSAWSYDAICNLHIFTKSLPESMLM